MKPIRAILFDFDGTLMDTTNLIIASFKHTVQKHLNRQVEAEELFPHFGRPLIDALEELAPEQGNELILTFRQFNLKHHDEMVTPFEQVLETLEKLQEMGIKLGIITSKARLSLHKGLELYNLKHYFKSIVALEDTKIHKPNPEPVLLGLKQLNVLPTEALVVGDSPHDIHSAHRANVQAAAVRWTSLSWESILAEKPEFILNSMAELPLLISSNNN